MESEHGENEVEEEDICRVCRMEETPEKPLHFPCVCTGSIKYIHQDCLVQWIAHSKKEYCELCNHKFTFKPVYSPDMPKSIPFHELLRGLEKNILRALRLWLHYTLVVVAWLGLVPLTAYRIYKCLFSGSLQSLISLPMDMLSLEDILLDCLFGAIVVGVSIGGFILILWLREQIILHGGPEWLNANDQELHFFQFDNIIRNVFGRGNIDQPQPVVFHDANIDQANNNEQEAHELGAGHDDDVHNEENDLALEEGQFGDDNLPEENANQAEDNLIVANEEEDNDQAPNPPVHEGQWNPDAIMEDLTWEKFLGLDGSFMFLEHVFWIISLNTSFVLVFGFCPYYIGQIIMTLFKFNNTISGTKFDGVVVLFIGYLFVAFGLVTMHSILRFTSLKRIRKTVGLSYIVLKVGLLMAVEIGLFPLICGWWLDICSLPLFGITPKGRKESFLYAPITSTFLHWLVGMLYVFYFAAFIILLREILRPGVLWFLRNINDPEFHPVKEMIQVSTIRHLRRFLLSLVVFGTTVLILVWIPVQLMKLLASNLIPFNVSLSSDAPISEMSLELLLLQVILPAFLEQGHTRRWLKGFIQLWADVVSYILDLRSYLIGDVPLGDYNGEQVIHVDNNGKWQRGPVPRGVHLENELEGVGSPSVRAYFRPKSFGIKMVCFLAIVVCSFIFASFTTFTLPVVIGRNSLWLIFGHVTIHELYTAAAGFYIIWVVMRILSAIHQWYPVGFLLVYEKMKTCTVIIFKVVIAATGLLGVIPLFLGIFFELVVQIPLRVPVDQTPLLYIWQDWALGVLHLKIICAVILIGPEWWLRDAIDRVYRNGFVNMDLTYIITNIIYPVSVTLLFGMSVPYVLTVGVMPLLGFEKDVVIPCVRRIYPTMLFTIVVIGAIIFQGKQCRSLYERIKNEKYLVGKVLVNYEPFNSGNKPMNQEEEVS